MDSSQTTAELVFPHGVDDYELLGEALNHWSCLGY